MSGTSTKGTVGHLDLLWKIGKVVYKCMGKDITCDADSHFIPFLLTVSDAQA
jgi:hypothetical protein